MPRSRKPDGLTEMSSCFTDLFGTYERTRWPGALSQTETRYGIEPGASAFSRRTSASTSACLLCRNLRCVIASLTRSEIGAAYLAWISSSASNCSPSDRPLTNPTISERPSCSGEGLSRSSTSTCRMMSAAHTHDMVRWSSPLDEGRKSTSPGAPCLSISHARSYMTFWKSGCVMRRLSTLGAVGRSLCARCSATDRKSALAKSCPLHEMVTSHLSMSTSAAPSTTAWNVEPTATGSSDCAYPSEVFDMNSAGRKACMLFSSTHHMPAERSRVPARSRVPCLTARATRSPLVSV
mmetsp:Transcript_13633/g.35417  ORF Transcript_13633/g.35417 Transcript_13633/m.35417 type:complete len:294 (-) Transcript_13633:90-971(-)